MGCGSGIDFAVPSQCNPSAFLPNAGFIFGSFQMSTAGLGCILMPTGLASQAVFDPDVV